MVRFLTLSWNDIMSLTIKLSFKLIESNYLPDTLVGILRGGWIITRLLSDFLSIDSVDVVGVKFYKGVEERHEKPVVTHPLISDVSGKKVLIVDDVADSGRTLQTAVELVQLYNPKEVRTASLYVKPWSVIVPDYYVSKTDAWIVFPWEYAETLRNLMRSRGVLPRKDELLLIADEVGLKGYEFIDDLVSLVITNIK
ncbi:MAG: phosphoribosyltransferase [Desulfurococcaceae archaeon]|nr:phosphoribosyltransferase [Desulfurococcaceae archaeon]